MRAAARELGVNYSTIQSACQAVKLSAQTPPPPPIPTKEPIRNQWLDEIAERFTPQELQAIAKGARLIPGVEPVPVVSFSGKRIRFGTITDTHIGHKRSPVSRIEQAFEVFHQERVDFITHSGDVTEGMSHRPGHIYELDHLGYDAQKDEAIKIFGQWTDSPIYAIDGNHDRWFIKSNGAIILKDIAAALTNFKFLGHDEGDISLDGRATLKLWHGEDGNSYALSYRLQKLLESLSGGEKPNILVAGHTHKFTNIFERNVWCVSTGSMQSQTSWMRGKRIAAHVGFCVCDAWVPAEGGVSKFSLTWYPFYA
jgi:predicted phosphodiesterase